MYSYKPLEAKIKDLGLTKSSLTEKLGISSRTIAKMSKGEKIAAHVLRKISFYLGCASSELYFEICDNPILQTLREEKEHKISGGLYHELQVRMTYNSSHMEGSTLSEDQTRLIFETETICAGEGVKVNDIIETANHFRAVDYVIDKALSPLSEEFIKHLHLLLKQSTNDSNLSWFAVGNYKKRENTVGAEATCPVDETEGKMHALLQEYSSKKEVDFTDIASFHAEFESIHPFQDGNGRVGRLIILKECLRFGITPFFIEDSKKAFYYRGLQKWGEDKTGLIDACLDGQDSFNKLLAELGIKGRR
jgi:DNA-binding Xre family transcriptional regulator